MAAVIVVQTASRETGSDLSRAKWLPPRRPFLTCLAHGTPAALWERYLPHVPREDRNADQLFAPVKQFTELRHRHAKLIALYSVNTRWDALHDVLAPIDPVNAEKVRVGAAVHLDFWFGPCGDCPLVLQTQIDYPTRRISDLPRLGPHPRIKVTGFETLLPPNRRQSRVLVGTQGEFAD